MNLVGRLSAVQGLSASVSTKAFVKMQPKEVVPTDEEQVIVADEGYVGLSRVTISAIPSNYGRIVFNGSYLLVE